MIRWKRSVEGFVESHDGHWKITPNYFGCVEPQSFRLVRDRKTVSYSCSTQRDAKVEAERLVTQEHTAMRLASPFRDLNPRARCYRPDMATHTACGKAGGADSMRWEDVQCDDCLAQRCGECGGLRTEKNPHDGCSWASQARS